MKYFDTDYMAGAHPEVLRRLVETNLLETSGYGSDEFTASTRKLVRTLCGDDSLDVYFLVGGTQTNAVMADALLSHSQGVLCCESAHINVHEAGAIEYCGHKVISLPSINGKVSPADVSAYIDDFYADQTNEHMVAPGMLYISYPTELGTLYSKHELEDLHSICQKAGIPVYIDGARLGYGLASPLSDITLKDIPTLCEAFYIGGTKVGAMFGECVVAKKGYLKRFLSLVKEHGALLAKGRLLALQFEALLKDGLYFEISVHAVKAALILKEAFVAKGYYPFIDSPTNQQFFTLPNDVMDTLAKDFSFEVWGRRGKESTTVRFVTSWATKIEDVKALIEAL